MKEKPSRKDEGVPFANISKKGLRGEAGKMPFLLVGLLGLVLAAGLGAAAYLGYLPIRGFSGGPKEEARPSKGSELGPTIKLSPIIVNLKGDHGGNYLKTTLILEVDRKEWVEEIQSRISSLTDIVISTLCDKKIEEVKQPGFKEELRKELLDKMAVPQGPRKIRQIYFDEFLYQQALR